MDTETLFASVQKLLEQGEEQPLRDFLVAHLNEFPEDIKNELVTFFFEEAVIAHAEGIEARAELVQEAVENLEGLEAVRVFLEEKIKLAKVRGRLNTRE